MVPINFFTFNMGGQEDNWGNISTDWVNFFKSKTDNIHEIWVICTQEDKQESSFIKAISSFFVSSHKKYADVPKNILVSGLIPESLQQPFFVNLAIFIPNSLVADNVMTNIQSTYMYHPVSASVIDSSFFHKSSIVINLFKKLIIVGSHLPFDKHDETNAKFRLQALNSILNIRGNLPMFIFGDLNFRVTDKVKFSTDVQDFTQDLSPTCKTIVVNTESKAYDDNCTKVFRKTSTNTNTANCYNLNIDKTESKLKLESDLRPLLTGIQNSSSQPLSIEKKKKDPLRTPSICDRVLFIDPENKLRATKSTSEQILFHPVPLSDHNAVHVRLEIDGTYLFGGPNGGAKPLPASQAKLKTKTNERIMFGKRTCIVYKGPRGHKYVKDGKGNFVTVKSLKSLNL